MTYSVYQHWDPLKVCVVGRSYPPEFYNWIKVPHVRELFEKIAIETEEDYLNIIKTLEKFGVRVIRPKLSEETLCMGQHVPPPMTPRDSMTMIGERFYHWPPDLPISAFYDSVKDPSWPECTSYDDFHRLPRWIIDECFEMHDLQSLIDQSEIRSRIYHARYKDVFDLISQQGNQIIKTDYTKLYSSGAMVSRIGRDLYIGTNDYRVDQQKLQDEYQREFPDHRVHVVNTGGHSDGTYCPVCPGLIISLQDVPTYADTYPDWEVVYLPGQSWEAVQPFLDLKKQNAGKWWIPGFEKDQAVIDTVETWLGHWTGYVEETVFDVNMLIIDPKNVMVFNYNKQVFDALERYGITPHIVPFRHRYFWDGGIHCVTSDLYREGTMQNYFPERD